MAKMRVIAPEMQRMKEEFGEDRMRFSQEMMALYKREQVNPLQVVCHYYYKCQSSLRCTGC